MASKLLIRGARQLLTLRGPSGPRRGSSLLDLGIIPDGALLIKNGVIAAVGPSRRIQSLAAARGSREVDATGKVVMPAFVDLETSIVHAHPPQRSFERLLLHYNSPDFEAFRDVLEDGARALSALSSQTLKRRANRLARNMIQHGTGTIETRAGYRLEESAAMKVLRVQSECGYPADVASTFVLELPRGADPERWAQYVVGGLLPTVRRRRLAQFVNLAYDSDTLPASTAARILEGAAKLGFSLKLHTDLFARATAIDLAVRCRAIAVGHLRHATPSEIELLAASSTIAVLKPGMVFQTGPTFAASGRAMIDAGVAPAIASGYHAELSPGYNMQFVMLLACRLYQLRPEEAITAATINGATALRAAGTVGSLEAGKQADVLVMDVPDYREVAYYAGANIVEKVLKRGEVVYDSRSGNSEDGD